MSATTATPTAAARVAALEDTTAFQDLGAPIQQLLRKIVEAECAEQDKVASAATKTSAISAQHLQQLTKVTVKQLAKVFEMLTQEEDPMRIWNWLIPPGTVLPPVPTPVRNRLHKKEDLVAKYKNLEKQNMELMEGLNQLSDVRDAKRAANVAERKKRQQEALDVLAVPTFMSTTATSDVATTVSGGELGLTAVSIAPLPTGQDVNDVLGVFNRFATMSIVDNSAAAVLDWWKQGDEYRRDFERHGRKGKLWTSVVAPATQSASQSGALRAPVSELDDREEWYRSQCWWRSADVKREWEASKDTAWWKEECYIRDWQTNGFASGGGEENAGSWVGGEMWLAVDEATALNKKGGRFRASFEELCTRVKWYRDNGPKGVVKRWCALNEGAIERCSLDEKCRREDFYRNGDWWKTDEVAFTLLLAANQHRAADGAADTNGTSATARVLANGASSALFAPGSVGKDTEWWKEDQYRQDFSAKGGDYKKATAPGAAQGGATQMNATTAEVRERERWYTENWWKAPEFIKDYVACTQGRGAGGRLLWKAKKMPTSTQGGCSGDDAATTTASKKSNNKKIKKCRESEARRREQWYKSHVAATAQPETSDNTATAVGAAAAWWKLGDVYLRDFQENGTEGKLWTSASDPSLLSSFLSPATRASSSELELRAKYFEFNWWKADAYVKDFQHSTHSQLNLSASPATDATAPVAGGGENTAPRSMGSGTSAWKSSNPQLFLDKDWWKQPGFIQQWSHVHSQQGADSSSLLPPPVYHAMFERDATLAIEEDTASADQTADAKSHVTRLINSESFCGQMEATQREEWFKKNWWKSPVVAADYKKHRKNGSNLLNAKNADVFLCQLRDATDDQTKFPAPLEKERCTKEQLQARAQYFDLIDHPLHPEPASFPDLEVRRSWYQAQLTESEKILRRSWVVQHLDTPTAKITLAELDDLGKCLNDGQDVDPATLKELRQVLVHQQQHATTERGKNDDECLVSAPALLLALGEIGAKTRATGGETSLPPPPPFFIPWTGEERLRVAQDVYQTTLMESCARVEEEVAFELLEQEEEEEAARLAGGGDEDIINDDQPSQTDTTTGHMYRDNTDCNDFSSEEQRLWEEYLDDQAALEQEKEDEEGGIHYEDPNDNWSDQDPNATTTAAAGAGDAEVEGGAWVEDYDWDEGADDGEGEDDIELDLLHAVGDGELELHRQRDQQKKQAGLSEGKEDWFSALGDALPSVPPENWEDDEEEEDHQRGDEEGGDHHHGCATSKNSTDQWADKGGDEDVDSLIEHDSCDTECKSPPMQHKLALKKVPNPQYLKSYFTVLKVNKNGGDVAGSSFFGAGKPQKRVWVVDHFTKTFYNLDKNGKIKKEHTASRLLQVEKNVIDGCKLRLMFFDASHSNELQFLTPQERERFYETAQAIRPSIRVHAPDLIDPTVPRYVTDRVTLIDGLGKESLSVTCTNHTTGRPLLRELSGECKINASHLPTEPLKIWTGTFNLSGRRPPKTDPELAEWIPQPNNEVDIDSYAKYPGYDIYAIGVQETSYRQEDDEWNERVAKFLGRDFFCLAHMNLWDTELSVFCKKRHLTKITNVEGSTKATVHKAVCGTKGGIGISLKYLETSFCFVTCHLAARLERTMMRSTNLEEIFTGLQLGVPETSVATQFDHVFFFGDLNYRIELEAPVAEKLIEEGEFARLLQYDQLATEQGLNAVNDDEDFQGGVLHGFHEVAPITFAPTFRMNVGGPASTAAAAAVAGGGSGATPPAPGSPYNPDRGSAPSYCARILLKSLPCTPQVDVDETGWTNENCKNIKCLSYTSHPGVTTSEHLPMSASFLVRCLRPTMTCFSKALELQSPHVTMHLVLQEVHFHSSTNYMGKGASLSCHGNAPVFGSTANDPQPVPALTIAPLAVKATTGGPNPPKSGYTVASWYTRGTEMNSKGSSMKNNDHPAKKSLRPLPVLSCATSDLQGHVLLIVQDMAVKNVNMRHTGTGVLSVTPGAAQGDQVPGGAATLFEIDALAHGRCVGRLVGKYSWSQQ